MNQNRENWDVALSFAGEDREYVDEVDRHLKRLGIKSFYDKYEEVNLWGKDLYAYLSEVYGKRSKYCVMFISEAYARKLWTEHELRNAQARAFELQKDREYILPVRFDNTEIPGIIKTIGYIDGNREPQEIAYLIAKKLGVEIESANNENKLSPQFEHKFTSPLSSTQDRQPISYRKRNNIKKRIIGILFYFFTVAAFLWLFYYIDNNFIREKQLPPEQELKTWG